MEKAAIVGLAHHSLPRHVVEEYLEELASLVSTAGARVRHRFIQERERPDPATFIGRGKARDVAEICRQDGVKLVVFDDDLSPAQVRNLEEIFGVKVTDRTGVILDIFARRAKTKEAKTQVELAQYTYLLPRLTRAWTHLSRQAGGIGTRGVGETQLETDRRVIRRRIALLGRELEHIATRREVQRRRRRETIEVALVGYANVGKSTLLNRLTASRVLTEDRLFATLDTTFRRLHLEGVREEVLLIDTVGLIRKLPHHLVASFRSTLEQAAEADLLLHVVDVSHPRFEEQAYTTVRVLGELDMAEIPVLTVLNKRDMADPGTLDRAGNLYPEAVAVSARTGGGLEDLKRRISTHIHRLLGGRGVYIPYERWPEFCLQKNRFRILSQRFEEEGVRVTLRGGAEDREALARSLGGRLDPAGAEGAETRSTGDAAGEDGTES